VHWWFMWTMWLCELMIMCIDETWWIIWIWWLGELYELVIGELYDLVALLDDDYFGDSDEVWIICIWISDFLLWWWFPCLYFWNDELYLLSWLDKSSCDLYDICELDELYENCEMCALCKISKIACINMFSKWWTFVDNVD